MDFLILLLGVAVATAVYLWAVAREERRHGAELERIKAQADAALKTKAR